MQTKSRGDELGQKISGSVSSKADDATQKISNFQAQAPTVASYDPNAVLRNVTQASDLDKSNYKTEKLTGGYTGPKTVDEVNGYGDTVKATQNAYQNVQNLGSEGGRQQLLAQNFGRPQYSEGQNKLDQTLLQNSAGSKTALENTYSKYSNLNQLLDTAQTSVGTAVNKSNTQALANKNAFIPAENQATKSLLDPIQARAAQMNQDNPALISRYTNEANQDKFSDDTLKNLGLTAGQNIYGLNLGSYITPDATQVGVNNAATAEERSKYSALMSLLDNQQTPQITADGKQINPVSFNQAQFSKDLSAKDTEYKNAYAGQRGTVLNNQYLSNPNATGGYNAYIPGALTDRRDLSTATPKELESYWLPIFTQAASEYGAVYGPTRDAIAKSVSDWKNKYQPDRTITKA